ncbi:MAG TPA: hypothetical protein VK563_11425 [Puia sp.]|nr:hypothetical protein [Puia sp.]
MTKYTPAQKALSTGSSGLLCIFVLFLSLTHRVSAQEAPTKTIYFLAGPKDHVGGEGTGRHETRRDLLVLQQCIDSAINIKGVKIKTKFLYERDALNIDDMKDVAAIIVECSSETSSPDRTHPLFPPSNGNIKSYDKPTLAYLDQLDSLHKAGMGIMILHWGIAVGNQKAANYHLSWFGETALEGYTHNPLGYWTVTPIKSAEKHPILRGVKPWLYKDEIFSNLLVKANDPYRIDLLTGEAAKTNQGTIGPNCIASAYDKNGARGILWGGMDYHSALLNENYLRFVLNAIVWTAGIDVPKGGVRTAAKGLQLSPIRPDGFDKLKPDNFDTFNKK